MQVTKVLNNNVLIALNPDNHHELVLIGKGIGFGKKAKDEIDPDQAEKLYVLTSKSIQKRYQQVIENLDESFINLIHDIIEDSEKALGTTFNERIHLALTDHLALTVQRLNQGLDLSNPFVEETKIMYPNEYAVARYAIDRINQALNITLPEGEVGFVALHFHSASKTKSLSLIDRYSDLVTEIVKVIEDELDIKLERTSMNYLQLVQHIRHTITRIEQDEEPRNQEKLAVVLKTEYPVCYNLSWKLLKVIEQVLSKPVSDEEAVYLTLHLQRLSPK